jgi:hypothetical protein
MPSVGINKDYQVTPYGQSGGLNAFPAAGIVSGLTVALAGTAGVGTPNTSAAITVAAGSARFNGKLCTLSTNTAVTLPVGVNLTTTARDIKIFLNPPRKVKTFFVGGAFPSAVIGDYAIEVRNVNESYYIVNKIYKFTSTGWGVIDPMSDIPFEYGFNNLPFNEVSTTLSASNFSLVNEVPIFLDTALPPHVAKSANALLRQSAGILLGEISFVGGVGTITKGIPNYHLLNS